MILSVSLAAMILAGTGILVEARQRQIHAADQRTDRARQALADAHAAFTQKQYDLALTRYQQFGDQYADLGSATARSRAGVLYSRAYLAQQAGRYDEARGLFQQIDPTGVDPTQRPALLAAIDEAGRLAAFEEGMRQIDQALATRDYDQARTLIARWRKLTVTPAEDDRLGALSLKVFGQQADAGLRHQLDAAHRLARDGQTDRAIALIRRELDRAKQQGITGFAVQQMEQFLTELNNQAAFDAAMAAAGAAIEAGDLTQAIAQYRLAQQMRPTPEIETALARAESDLFLGQGLEALAQGNTADAEQLLTAALGRNPDNTAARRELDRLESSGQRLAFIRAAEDALAVGDYDTAIKQFQNAQPPPGSLPPPGTSPSPDPANGPATTAPDPLAARIDQAHVRLDHQRGVAAVAAGELDAARGFFDAALARAPHDEATRQALAQLETLTAYTHHKDAGDRARENADFGQALRQYHKAGLILKTPELLEAQNETEYAQMVAQARAYIDAEDYRSARNLLRVAWQLKQAQEVRDLIDLIEQHTAVSP